MGKSILLCDYCGWKSSSDLEDVYELKNDTLSNKKYRCKKCGRGVTPRKTKDPQKDLDKKIEEEKIKKENDEWMKSVLDFQINFLQEEENE